MVEHELAVLDPHAQIPEYINTDEPIINENDDSSIEMNTYHIDQPEISDERPDSRFTESVDFQEEGLQQKDNGNIDLINTSMAEPDSFTAGLQEGKFSEYDELVEPLVSDQSALSSQYEPSQARLTYDNSVGTDNNVWTVHLAAYYSKPPPDIELEFLRVAGVRYEIIRVILDGKVWYRVLVSGFLQYGDAREYARMMESKFGINKIWISNMRITFE